MTDATLKIILENFPSIIGAVLAGAATVISTLGFWKGKENGNKADAANVKADAIAVKTEEIHSMTNGNFYRVKEELRLANESISKLQTQDDSRVIAILQRHQVVLTRMDGDISQLTVELKGVRQRQHDLANFLNEMGLKYDLAPIPKRGPEDAS